MGYYRDQLGPLFEHVFQDAIQQCSTAEQELRSAIRSAFHRINLVDRRFDALIKRTEALHSRYEPAEDESEEDAPLYQLMNEMESDGIGPPDLDELRGLLGEAMKQIHKLVRDLERQRRDFAETVRDIKE